MEAHLKAISILALLFAIGALFLVYPAETWFALSMVLIGVLYLALVSIFRD